MPERQGASNMWQLDKDEFFVPTTGKKVFGPGVFRIDVYEELNLISVQGNEDKWEVNGTDFASAVKTGKNKLKR